MTRTGYSFPLLVVVALAEITAVAIFSFALFVWLVVLGGAA